jgi:hypothetical protein
MNKPKYVSELLSVIMGALIFSAGFTVRDVLVNGEIIRLKQENVSLKTENISLKKESDTVTIDQKNIQIRPLRDTNIPLSKIPPLVSSSTEFPPLPNSVPSLPSLPNKESEVQKPEMKVDITNKFNVNDLKKWVASFPNKTLTISMQNALDNYESAACYPIVGKENQWFEIRFINDKFTILSNKDTIANNTTDFIDCVAYISNMHKKYDAFYGIMN